MNNSEDRRLLQALDYILNHAGLREIDALESAVERRRNELSAKTGIFSLDPERTAKKISGAVHSSIERTMDGVRDTLRDFALDLLDKEAPELSEAEKIKLVESWIPQGKEGKASFAPSFTANYPTLAKNGTVNGIPCEMLKEMVSQFVAYSIGKLPAKDEAALRRDVGEWPAAYWRRFPEPLQMLIKAYVAGDIPQEELEAALSTMLD